MNIQHKKVAVVTDDELQHVITTNLCSLFSLRSKEVKHMLTKNSGCITNISSMVAQYSLPKVMAYCYGKSAIDFIRGAMYFKLSPKGIRVNAIAPGFIYSAIKEKDFNCHPNQKANVFARTPIRKIGQPEIIAAVAVYLASVAA